MDNDNDSSMTAALDDCEARLRRLVFKTDLHALGDDGCKWFGVMITPGPPNSQSTPMDAHVMLHATEALNRVMREHDVSLWFADKGGSLLPLDFEPFYPLIVRVIAQNPDLLNKI